MRHGGLTPRGRAFVLMAAVVAVGATSFTLIELVLRHLSPSSMAAGRVVFSAIAFVLIVSVQPRRRTRVEPRDRWRMVLCGLGGSAGFHLLFSAGQDRVTVATSAVVLGTMPAMVALAEWLLLGQRLIRPHLIGVLLSVVGIVVISWGAGDDGTSTMLGIVLVGGATVVWAGVTVATRSLADRYDPWWLNTPGTVVGALVMLAVAAPDVGEFGDLSLATWMMLLWLGVAGSAFIYAALAGAMRVLSATTTASLSTLVTPVSIVIAWIVLDEVPNGAAALGSAVVVAGVALVSLEPGTGRRAGADTPAAPAASDRSAASDTAVAGEH